MRYLTLIGTAIVLSGCGGGSSGIQTTYQDGKGDIDLVEYLPFENIKKSYVYGMTGSTLYSSGGYRQNIISKGKINVETHAIAHGRFYDGEHTTRYTILYSDSNITNFFDETNSIIDLYTPKSNYRYIDIKNLISKNEKTEETIVDYDSSILNIGKRIEKSSYTCYYKGFTNTIKDDYDKIIKKDANFLIVECKTYSRITYDIKDEYKELKDSGNGKVDYEDTTHTAYYQKGIGLVYANIIVDKSSYFNEGITPLQVTTYTVTNIDK